MRVIFLTFLTLVSSSPLSSRFSRIKSAKISDDENINYRLPNDTIPVNYNILIRTQIDQGIEDFSGNVDIRILVMKNTTKIVIHSRQQEIGDIYLYRDPDRQINIIPTTSKYNETLEFLEISTTEILISGKEYLISIDYKGKLRDDNLGFYRSSYINEDDERVWLAATQFEETEARHAFPCYDEPQIRTPFKILIEHHKSYEAISNWPKESEMELGGSENVMTIFEETDPIQTYLVAFIISNFDNLTSNDSKPIQRVFAKPSSIKKDEAESALLDGVKLLAKFEEYFNVSYRPPKMDQVALPDFDAGAMENYALVTYREEYLLLNNESTSREKKNVLTTISHEFAHQWFGDYVNPVWWSYLWLNEGFATFYEYFMASLVYPDIRLMDEFVIDVVQNALEVDANQYIRPMTFYVEKPNEIDDLFDRIAYDKSGSVLRMFQNALGEKIWSKGLTNYLNTMKMSAASSDDLYKGIQTSIDYEIPTSNINISTIMKTWENQAGFPLITVSREGKMLKFTQERFYNENSNTTSSNDTWWIPINFASDLNADFIQLEPEFWMFEKSYLFELSENDSKSWIIVNKQQGFYYRVNYDETLWNLIINQLNGKDHKKIHILNRAQLIDDSLNLAKAGKISYSIPLEILSYLQNETDYIPWAAANRGLTLLNQWLSGTSIYTTYQSFVRRIVQQFFDKFGVNSELSEERLDNFAPQIAINLACTMNHQTCLSQSSEKLKEMFQNNLKTYISPDVRSAIYCNGLRSGDSTLFLLMRDKMIKSNDQAERTLLINSLGCAQNENLLNSLLYLAIFEGNNFRLQEKTRVLMAPLNSGLVGLKVMMNFIQLNQQAISEISSSHINTMLTSIASRIPTNSLYTEFKDLLTFLKSINGISDNTQSILLESANSGLKWQSQYLDEISTWLENTENPQVPSTTEESTTTTMTTSTTSSLSTISQSSEPVTTTTSSATSESSVIMETTTEDILTTTQGNADSILISILLIITCSMVEYLL